MRRVILMNPQSDTAPSNTRKPAPPPPRRKVFVILGLLSLLAGTFLLLPDPGGGPLPPPGPITQEMAARIAVGDTREKARARLDESALQAVWQLPGGKTPQEITTYRFKDGTLAVTVNLLHNRVEKIEATGFAPGGAR